MPYQPPAIEPVPDWVSCCAGPLEPVNLVMSMPVPLVSVSVTDADSVPLPESVMSLEVLNPDVVAPVQVVALPLAVQAASAWLAVSAVRAAPPNPAPRTIAAAPASAKGDARPTDGA